MAVFRSSALVSTLCLFTAISLGACGGGELDTSTPTNGAGATSAAGTSTNQGGSTSSKGGAAGKSGGSPGGAAGTSGSGGASGSSGASGASTGGKAGSGGGAGAAGAGAGGKAGAGAGGTTGGASGKSGAAGKAGSGGAGPVCGDGTKNGSEQCDKTDLAGATCSSVLKTTAMGPLACFGNCSFDTSKCVLGGGMGGASGSGGAPAACGDGSKNGNEQCDGTDLAGATCSSAIGDPGATGMLACFGNCTFDASKCAISMGTGGAGGAGTGGSASVSCGDGVKNGTDQCDGTDIGMDTCAAVTGDPKSTGSVACFANCTIDLTGCTTPSPVNGTFCGDSLKNGAEQCDGAAFGAATCDTAVGAGSTGTLACHANCTIDASACSLPTGGGAGGAAGSAGASGSAGAGGAVTCGAGAVPCPAGKTCLGNAPCCVPTTCQGKTYACGDCLDNDGDGLVDTADPSCLGPCSDNESGYLGNIPGQQNAACKMDCYFDQDSGAGNDDCHWDHRCDDHELSPGFYPEASCNYACSSSTPTPMCTQKPPALGGTCAAEYATQSASCKSFCGPLTPNGCDCFGCCELPAASGKFVYLGSTDAGGLGTCDPASVDDPTKCHPCTPVAGCYNACDHCELCIGKPDLPADCLPPVPKCGDGIKNGVDQCDGADLGMPTPTCASFTGNAASTGTLSCNANCTLDGGNCTTPTPICGDGVIEGFEECDGANLGSPAPTCATYTGIPTATGNLVCNANCTLNGNMCSVPPPGTGGAGGAPPLCGDGVKNGSEQCDMTDLGTATCRTVLGSLVACGTLKCNANCTLDSSACTLACGQGGSGPGPSCGDGLINQPSEQCDGMDLGGATCASATGNPNSMGTITCFANCTLDTGMCMVPVGGSGGAGGSCGGQVCGVNEQPCGLSCQGPCPVGQFCITGCCVGKPLVKRQAAPPFTRRRGP